MPYNLYLIMAARGLIGFGHGCAYLTAMIHASEIVTQKLRGMVVSSLNFLTVSSIMIAGIQTMYDDESNALNSIQYMGITSLVFCVIGLVLVPIFIQESPVRLIRERKFNEALLVMCELRSESQETTSIRSEFEELRSMVEEDEMSSKNIFDEGNLHPLQSIVLLKIGSVLAFNFCVNVIRLKYASMFIGDDGIDYAAMTFMIIRMMGCLVALFTIDALGRRIHFILSFGGSSLLLIAMAVVVVFYSSLSLWVIGSLQLCFELIGGFGIVMISDVYAAEAFNTMKKPRSIAFASAVEFSLHAIIITATFSFVPSERFDWIYLSIPGGLLLAITAYLFMKLPETAKKSIRQTRNEFVKVSQKTSFNNTNSSSDV